jgi:hypothetical protein
LSNQSNAELISGSLESIFRALNTTSLLVAMKRRPIFRGGCDFARFLEIIEEMVGRFRLRLHGYAGKGTLKRSWPSIIT